MKELSIRLDTEKKEPLYEQIYGYIKDEIRIGKLLFDERLPSTRFLAEYLQVSRSTVELAYEQLEAEGYIEARPYRGYYVCTLEKEFMNALGNNTESLTDDKKNKEEFLYDFSPNGIDLNGFPFSVWKKISRAVLTEANSELFELGDPKGDFELRETIARYLHASRGVKCNPGQIIIGAGNDYLLLLLEKILGKNHQIGMEPYTYQRACRIFRSEGYQVGAVRMDEMGMTVEGLNAINATAAYVMPAHQFPFGIVMPIGRRMELLRWANEKKERYLIEDDYDSEFRYRGKPIPSLQASDRGENVIYIGTFSKSIAPAIRISFMVLPPILVKQYERNCPFLSSTVSRIDQKILNIFLKDGYYERHLNRMRKVYREKHDYLVKELETFKQKFHIKGENAGLHFYLEPIDNVSEKELIELAKRESIRVHGISDTCITNENRKNGIVLGYAGLSMTDLQEGIAALKKAW